MGESGGVGLGLGLGLGLGAGGSGWGLGLGLGLGLENPFPVLYFKRNFADVLQNFSKNQETFEVNLQIFRVQSGAKE